MTRRRPTRRRPSGASDVQHVSLADVITVEEPTRVAVRCSEFAPGDLDVLNLKLTAISVDEVVTF